MIRYLIYLFIYLFTLEDRGQDASEWRAWRDKLRNITLQEGFPRDFVWPEQPA